MNAIAYIYTCGNNQKSLGHIYFEQKDKYIKITIELTGLSWGYHGCHIHTKGVYDINAHIIPDCSKLGGHLKLSGQTHGNINEKGKHIGDLGNIYANIFGKVNTTLYANRIKITDILNKFVIIHANKDDLGLGGNEESLKTGNSLKFQRRMVHSDESITLKINNNIDKNNK